MFRVVLPFCPKHWFAMVLTFFCCTQHVNIFGRNGFVFKQSLDNSEKVSTCFLLKLSYIFMDNLFLKGLSISNTINQVPWITVVFFFLSFLLTDGGFQNVSLSAKPKWLNQIGDPRCMFFCDVTIILCIFCFL